MQNFSKHSRTRLMALCLSAGLVMGSLSGCGGQDNTATDTVAESTVSASGSTTDVTMFSMPEGPEESTIYVEPVVGISDVFSGAWMPPRYWHWRTAGSNTITLTEKNRMYS